MVMGEDLLTYYQENLLLIKQGFTLEAIENMLPYEKQIYMSIHKKLIEPQ